MDQALTNEQAFEAMRNFLAQFNEREPVERRESIAQLLRWTAAAIGRTAVRMIRRNGSTGLRRLPRRYVSSRSQYSLVPECVVGLRLPSFG
jgi:hypothetical protein